jgi:hypothetical protein
MKKVLLVILLHCFASVSYFVRAQTIIYTSPQTLEGGYFDNQYVRFYPTNSDINYFQDDKSWEYLSPEIYIKPQSDYWNFHAKGVNSSSTGNLHLTALRNDLSITASSSTVTKYQLFEIKFKYSDIDEKVNRFLNDTDGTYKPSYNPTSAYVTGFNNGLIINPYDPDHISVDAVFWAPGQHTYGTIRYGFFYRDYTRDTSNASMPWVENTNESGWRVRFSPDQTGTWNYYVTIWIGGKMVAQSGMKTLSVTSSSDNGFVKVANGSGENFESLKFSDGSQQKFVPIGNNYAGTVAADNSNNYLGSDRMSPDAYYQITSGMNKFSGTEMGESTIAGNATRLIFAPWSYHVEWEKLNNYDTRQIEMWELDQYLLYLTQKKIYLTLAIMGSGEIANAKYWNSSPYNSLANDPFKGIPELISAEDFYSNTNARKFLEKKLRYIHSRWGYSPYMMLYELINEVDNSDVIEPKSSPQSDDCNLVSNWYDEMAVYLKNVLGCKQLISFSIGRGDDPNWSNFPVFSNSNMDVILIHHYLSREATSRLAVENINRIKNFIAPQKKPILVQECGDTKYYDDTHYCTDLHYHQINWSYNIAGSAGTYLWVWRFLNLQPFKKWFPDNFEINFLNNITNHPKYEGEYYTNLSGLKTFYSNPALEPTTKYYTSNYLLDGNPNNQWYELIYKISSDKTRVIGWFHNRSSNQFNCLDCLNNSYYWYKPSNNLPWINVGTVDSFNLFKEYQCISENPDVPWWMENSPMTFGQTNKSCTAPILLSNNVEANYNKSFSNWFPTNQYGFVGKGIQPLSISGLDPNATYNLQWYWTWDPDGLQSNGNQTGAAFNGDELVSNSLINSITVNSSGIGYFNGPPTVKYGSQSKIYPGDWALVIQKTGTKSSDSVTLVPSMIIDPDVDIQISQIGISPNPTDAIITVSLPQQKVSYRISVYNAAGMKVLEDVSVKENHHSIDLSNYSNGVYILNITTDSFSRVYKVIKQK